MLFDDYFTTFYIFLSFIVLLFRLMRSSCPASATTARFRSAFHFLAHEQHIRASSCRNKANFATTHAHKATAFLLKKLAKMPTRRARFSEQYRW